MEIKISNSYLLTLFDSLAKCQIKLFKGSEEIEGSTKELILKSGMKDNSVYATFEDVEWENVTMTADSAIIETVNRSVVMTIKFDKEYQSINGMFKIKFPERLIAI